MDERLTQAVRKFWRTRKAQREKQRDEGAERDRGARSAVTGKAQLDGVIRLVEDILEENGLPEADIYRERTDRSSVTIPGYFRPTKEWDLLVVADGSLVATIEFKSQVGPSFGNNFNNRTEEALGSATDLWTAYREGVYPESPRPWLGYFMLLEDAPDSRRPIRVKEPHFEVSDVFHDASYADRYETLCTRLERERLYDATCLILSDREGGLEGRYTEPSDEISFRRFAASLIAKVAEYKALGESGSD